MTFRAALRLLAFAVLPQVAFAQAGWTYTPQEITKENLWSVAYGSERLIAVGQQGALLSYSYADTTWRAETRPGSLWLVGVGYGAGRFVVVGEQGVILTSDDQGLTWTARPSGTSARLNAVAYGGGRWLAVGENGAVVVSSDATTWSARPALGPGFLRALAFGQGQFLIGGANGSLYATANGVDFTRISINTTADIETAAISPARFWIAGSRGFLATATRLNDWNIGPTLTSATFRGLVARNDHEAVAVGDEAAVVFRQGTWSADAPPPPFLATAATLAGEDVITVGFNGGIARADRQPPVATLTSARTAEYGSPLRIIVTPRDPGTVYQWYNQRGEPIAGATGPELFVPAITPSNASYSITYSNQPGFTTGIQIRVYPAGAPEVRDAGFTAALPRLPALVVPQPDGKLLVAGTFSVSPTGGPTQGIARLNANGSLDLTFRAGDGVPALSTVTAMRLAPDGRIYVGGYFASIAGQARPGLARLLPNGALDESFRPGISERPVHFAVAPDARTYVQLGSATIFEQNPSVRRLSLNGSDDASFPVLTQHELVGVDDRGRLLAKDFSGPSTSSALLVRYLPDGTRDPTYLPTEVTDNVGVTGGTDELAITVIADSGLYAASSSWNRAGTSYTFTKFLPDGGRDPSYQRPPPTFSSLTAFAYRKNGGLWQVQRPFPAVAGTGFVATAYGPTGERDRTRYATLPDQGDFELLAVGADDSLLAIRGRYTDPQNQSLVRIRPLTGRPGVLTNLSVRAPVLTGNDPLIVGFVTHGIGLTTALVRAAGPSLNDFGVSDAMPDPRLEFRRDQLLVASSDNWAPSLAPRFASVGAFAFALGSPDAALETNIEGGNYTALVVPANGSGGTVLLELYHSADAFTSTRQFINLSARGRVAPSQPLIAGFSVSGDVPLKVLIRATGPALAEAPFHVPDTLTDPRLRLFRNSTQLWENDDWHETAAIRIETENAAAAVAAFPLKTGSKDSAAVLTLSPGNYTAVVTGPEGASGTSLIEVYAVP